MLTARRGDYDGRFALSQDAVSAEEVVEDGIVSVRIQSTEDVVQDDRVLLSVHSSCQTLHTSASATSYTKREYAITNHSLALASAEHNALASDRGEISPGELSEILPQGARI